MTQFSSLAGELLSRELGSDDSTDLYTTQRRQDAIVEAAEQFLDLTECVIRESSFNCSNGTAEYNLLSTTFVAPGDFVRVAARGPEYRIRSSTPTAAGSTTYVKGDEFRQTSIERLNRENPGWQDSTGARLPQAWYTRQESGRFFFGFYPPPTIRSSEVGTLMVPYVPFSSLSTVSTTEPFTMGSTFRTDLRPYHRALPHYAAHELLKLRKDDARSDRQLQKFLGYVKRWLDADRPKSDRRVVLGRRYFQQARGSRRLIAQEGVDPFKD